MTNFFYGKKNTFVLFLEQIKVDTLLKCNRSVVRSTVIDYCASYGRYVAALASKDVDI